MKQFVCPYIGGEVELTDEREQHISTTHPDLLPNYLSQLEETLADPDQVRRSTRMEDALLFSKRFEAIKGGKHIVVVVVTEQARHWIITAYLARRLTGGLLAWQKT
jgi:hypothetical protein